MTIKKKLLIAGLALGALAVAQNPVARGVNFAAIFTGMTANRTYTMPDANATVLTTNAAVTATQGGTGQTTWTTGDLLYASASNTLAKLGIGTTGQVLKVTGGVPVWGAAGGGGVKSVAYGSLPTCDASVTDVLYLITDGAGYFAHCDGTAFKWYFQGTPVTPPGLLSLTTVNSPTTATFGPGYRLLAPATSGEQVRSIRAATPGGGTGSNFTIEGAFMLIHSGQDFNWCGIEAAAGTSTGSALHAALQEAVSAAHRMNAYSYSSSTALVGASGTAASKTLVPSWPGRIIWMQIQVTVGGTWTHRFSYDDKQTWTTIGTVSQPFTATHFGAACNTRGAAGDAAALVLSLSAF